MDLVYEDEKEMLKAYQRTLFGGAPEDLPEKYAAASPLTEVDRYRAPVFISEPESDSRTPLRPGITFVDALRDWGGIVELHLMAGGHAGPGVEQSIDMMQRWIDFSRNFVMSDG